RGLWCRERRLDRRLRVALDGRGRRGGVEEIEPDEGCTIGPYGLGRGEIDRRRHEGLPNRERWREVLRGGASLGDRAHSAESARGDAEFLRAPEIGQQHCADERARGRRG